MKLFINKPNKYNKIDLFINNPYTGTTVYLSGCQLNHSSSELLPYVYAHTPSAYRHIPGLTREFKK
jgi:hypothetical protein